MKKNNTARQTNTSKEKRPFHALFDALPDAILIHPLKEQGFGRFIDVNQAACDRYGYSYEEFLKLTPADINVTGDILTRGAPRERARLAKAGKQIIRTKHRAKNGDQFPVEINSIIIDYQGSKAILSVVRDLSQREHDEEEVRRAKIQLEILHKLDQAILEAHSVAEISNAVLKNMQRHFPVDRLSIAIFSPETQDAEIYSSGILNDSLGSGKKVPLQTSFTNLERLKAGEIVRIDNLDAIEDLSDVLTQLYNAGIRSVVNIPIRAHRQLFGSFNIGYKAPYAISEQDIQIGREIADSIAIAVEQAQLYDALEQHAIALGDSLSELQEIYHLSLSLAHAQTAKQVAQISTRNLFKAINPDILLFYLRRRQKLILIASKANNISFDFSAASTIKSGECLCGFAVKSKKMVFSENISKDPRCTRSEWKNSAIQSFCALPLLANKKVIGIIALGSVRWRDFDNQKTFLETLANESALSLQNALLLEELRRHEMELEDRIAKRTAELMEANKELESFSYSVSHDLRAPLRAIDGFSRILSEDYGSQLDNEAKRIIGVIRKNTQRMAQLIDDLLSFSRTGRQILNPSKIDMTGLAEAIYYELTDEEQRQNIEFILQPLPKAWADSNLMRQVWNNLISNALKFTRTRKSPRIEIGSQFKENQLIYYIKDNGVGFNMKYADKLFQIFQRLHSEQEFEGTGVGLSIVHRIIKRHGGKVWALAQPDKGATFFFSLPLQKDIAPKVIN